MLRITYMADLQVFRGSLSSLSHPLKSATEDPLLNNVDPPSKSLNWHTPVYCLSRLRCLVTPAETYFQ